MDNSKKPPPLPPLPPPSLKSRRSNSGNDRIPLDIPLKIVIDDKIKNKKFSSILITQLNEDIRTTDDIDVKVLRPEQIVDNLEEETTKYESIECQTDDDMKFEKYFTELKPTFSDIESIGFYYFDAQANNYFISDDEAIVEVNSDVEDNCIGYEVFKRKSNNKLNTEPRSILKYKIMSTQTMVSILPDRTRSTQTSPSLLRDYVMNDLTNLLSTVDENGNNKPFKVPTNEDFVNKLKNESLLVAKRSNSASTSSNRSSPITTSDNNSSSSSTSFEQPIYDNLGFKYAELCQNEEIIESKNVESNNTLSEKSTSFYTVATHLTTNSDNKNVKNNNEQSSNVVVLDRYRLNDQLINLNQTLSDSEQSNDELDAKEVNNPINSQGVQSNRTSIITDEDIEEEDEDEPIDYIDNISETSDIYQNFIEEKLIKDKYEIFYPQSNNLNIQCEAKLVAKLPTDVVKSEASSTLISPNTIIYEPEIDKNAIQSIPKKTIKFNDELDIIEPSDYSTPTTSTSNLQLFAGPECFKIDCSSSDDAETTGSTKTKDDMNPPLPVYKLHIEKSASYEKVPEKNNFINTDKSSSTPSSPQNLTATNKEDKLWDNVPVKSYNSIVDNKAINRLDLNLEKTLNAFEMKESKTKNGLKYIERPSSFQIQQQANKSNSLERRLKASGFYDLIIDDDSNIKSKLPILDPPPRQTPSPPESPPPVPTTSPPRTPSIENLKILQPPERPPLPPLPLSKPDIPPRISSNSKFDRPSPPPTVTKISGSTESLSETLQNKSSSENSSFTRQETEHIIHKATSTNSISNVKIPLIVDTIEETRVTTSIISHKTIIKAENIIQSHTINDDKPSNETTNKLESESISMSSQTSSQIFSEPKKIQQPNETKLIFDEQSIKKFDVDFSFYDEESVLITTNEQTSEENFIQTETAKFDTNDTHNLSKETKLILDKNSTKPLKFDVDFSVYEEDQQPQQSRPRNDEKTGETITSELTDVTINTSRDRFSSLSNESKFLLNSSSNVPIIDIDFSLYEEQSKPESIKTQVEDVSVTKIEDVERNRPSLSKESKLILEDTKPKLKFEINLNDYDYEEKKPATPQKVLTDSVLYSTGKIATDQKPIQNFEVNFDDYEYVGPKPVKPQQLLIDTVSKSSGSTSSSSINYNKSSIENIQNNNFNAIDIPIVSSMRDRKKSLSTESKLLLNDKKNIQQFDIDFSIYDEQPKSKYNVENENIKNYSTIKLDKENSKIKKYDLDLNNYDENLIETQPRRTQVNSYEQNRNKFKEIDNLIDYQSPNNSFNKGLRQSEHQQNNLQKQPVKFVFRDWENMLNMVHKNDLDNSKDEESYNINDSGDNNDDDDDDDDDDGDDDGAGTDADIDDNDDQESNIIKQYQNNNQNTNGIVNMVFEPVINQNEDIYNTSPKKNENFIISPKKAISFNNDVYYDDYDNNKKQMFNFNDKDYKVSVTSVAPTGPVYVRKLNDNNFSTHTEQAEIRVDNKFDAQFDASGYNPPSNSPRQQKPIEIKNNMMKDNYIIKEVPKIHNPTEIEVENESELHNLIAKKRLRHQSGTSAAETSSILTETSIDASVLDGKYPNDLNSSMNSGGKLSKMQKIMLSIADREKLKLIRRIDRRKERVPEIVELLKTAKGKEKKKLEDELRILLRKEKKDEELMKKFNLIDSFDLKRNEKTAKSIKKTSSNEMLDDEVSEINTRKSPLSASATSLSRYPGSGSASGFSTNNNAFNDGCSSPGSTTSKKLRARESGYSSCDESGTEYKNYRRRYSSMGSESRLDRVDDEYPTNFEQANEHIDNQNGSSLQNAIKLAVNKLPIDSSTLIPSNTPSVRVLTKSPTLQLGYSNTPAAHKKIVFPPSNSHHQSSQLIDEPEYVYRPIRNNEETLNRDNNLTLQQSQQKLRQLESNESRVTTLRPPVNNIMKSMTSNRDADKMPPNGNNYQSTASNKSSSAIDRSKQQNEINRNQRGNDDDDDDEEEDDRRRNFRESRLDDEQVRIQYIDVEELGENYETKYRVERDRQTGEEFIMDYVNNVKYIIVKKSQKRDKKRSRSESDGNQNLIIEYITRSVLDNLRPGVELQFDKGTGESFVKDPNNENHRWIVLDDDWDANDVSNYISQEDVDSLEWNIFVEKGTNRKYIVDEKSGKRYYVVPDITDVDINNFLKQWSILSGNLLRLNLRTNNDEEKTSLERPKSISNKNSSGFQIKWPNNQDEEKQKQNKDKTLTKSPVSQTNSDTVFYKDSETIGIGPNIPSQNDSKRQKNNTNRATVGYVEIKELDGIDLNGVEILQDPMTDESWIPDRHNNRIWIILPEDWRELGLYISEEDLNSSRVDIYEDDIKRKYIIDEKTGNRYYIIPKVTNPNDKFKKIWQPLSGLVPRFDNVVWRKEFEDARRKEQEKNKPKDTKYKMPPFDSSLNKGNDQKRNKLEPIENLDTEPQNIVIKQKGKMGHIIRTDTRGQLKSSLKPSSQSHSPISRKDIPRALVLPKSPRPLHHLLLDERLHHLKLKELSDELENKENQLRSNSSSSLNQNWRVSSIDEDPTISRTQSKERGDDESPQLDRNKLADVQINGYRKEPKPTRRGGGSSLNSSYSRNISKSNPYLLNSTSGILSNYSYDSPFLTGVLTERFQTEDLWKRNHRGVQPKTRLFLKEQVLATPRSQEKVWRDTLSKSYKLKPRIIVINDDERIIAADKNCKVYVQYLHDHDSVLGVDPAYLLMIPDAGPVNPTRPLMVSLKQLEESGADIALREAPVFVYHENGNAYFENIAQYLAGKYPKLSPKTVRKILQFSNLQEFEDYLESKITRDEAQRILEETGTDIIDVDRVKRDLLNSISQPHSPIHYHANCEYDSLRNDYNTRNSNLSKNSEELYETKEIEIDGITLKSTYVSLTSNGDIQRVEPEELPASVIAAIKKANEYEEQKRLQKQISTDSKNRYERNTIIPSIISTPRSQIYSSIDDTNDDKPSTPIIAKPLIPFDEKTNNLRQRYERFNSNQM